MSDNKGISKSIFEDLDIDFSDMLEEPKAFAARVKAKASELEVILKSDTSVSALEQKVRDESKNAEVPTVVNEILDDLYQATDEATLPELVKTIERARLLVKELETAFSSRVMYDSVKDNSPVNDKKLAHFQHKRLREAYESYATFVEVFKEIKLPVINGVSGNFGSATPLERIVFEYIPTNEQFMNPHPVIRRLGLTDKLHSVADLIEYLQEHEDAPVNVKKVKL